MMNKEYKNTNKNDLVTKHHTSNVESESINNVNTYDKVKAAMANKTIHTENGNINLKNIKILQVNRSTSDFDAKQDLISFNAKENEADIIFITESNNKHTDMSKLAMISKMFKGYKLEESTQPNQDKSRCQMLIKSKL